MKIKIICAAMVALFNHGINAEEYSNDDEFFDDFYGSEEMVEIATGTKKQFHLLPSVATVISRQDIADMGALHLDEVLEQVPGLHVMPSGAARLTPVYSIRGLQTGFNPQILVLMNGVEFKHPTSSALTYGFKYPVHNVERIEVIRGPGSAVYGADAFSGVINIITRKPDDKNAMTVGISSGSFSTTDAWANINVNYNEVNLGLAINHSKTEGDKGRIVSSDLQSNFDSIFGTSASLAPGYLATQSEILNINLDLTWQDWSIENWYWSLKDGGEGNGATQTIDHQGKENAKSYLSKIMYKSNITYDWDLESQLSYYKTEADSYLVLFPEGTSIPIGDDGNLFTPNLPDVDGGGLTAFPDGVIGNPIPSLKETRFRLINTYTGFDNHNFRVALGWVETRLTAKEYKNFGPGVLDGINYEPVVSGVLTDVSGTTDVYVNDQTRHISYLTFQDEWRLSNDWELTIGVRYDDYSDFGRTINPRAAMVWQAKHNLTTKLMYGSAFRAPSFSELFLINNPAALGNKNLKPEEIDTLELVFDYRPSVDSKVAINFFKYKATDLIMRVKDQAPATTSTSQNARNQKGDGIEIEYAWDITQYISWNGSISYQKSVDNENDQKVADAPTSQVFTALKFKLSDNVKLTTQINHIRNRYRQASDQRAPMADYTLLNMALSYQPTKNMKLKLVAKNLLNKDYFEGSNGSIADDIPMEGRSVSGIFEYTFE